eukprot:CFRG2354T1
MYTGKSNRVEPKYLAVFERLSLPHHDHNSTDDQSNIARLHAYNAANDIEKEKVKFVNNCIHAVKLTKMNGIYGHEEGYHHFEQTCLQAQSVLMDGTARLSDCFLLINVFRGAGRPDLCVKTLLYMYKRGYTVKSNHYNNVIACLARKGRGEDCLLLLNEMKLRGVTPNMYSYRPIVHCGNLAPAAKKLVEREMRLLTLTSKLTVDESEIHIELRGRAKVWKRNTDSITRSHQLDGLFWLAMFMVWQRVLYPWDGVRVLHIFKEKNEPRWCDMVLKYLHECMDDPKANTSFSGFSLTTNHYTLAIEAHLNSEGEEGLERALSLLSEMSEVGCVANTDTYNSVIQRCETEKQYHMISKLTNSMREMHVEKDIYTYTSGLIAAFTTGDENELDRLTSEMGSQGVQPTTYSYTHLIKYLNSVGEYENALSLFNEMDETVGIEKSTDMYQSMITVCARAKNYDSMWHWIDTVMDTRKKASAGLTTSMFNDTLRVLCRNGEMKSCERLVARMWDIGTETCVNPGISNQHMGRPNSETYEIILSENVALGKSNSVAKTARLVKEMVNRGVTPSLKVFLMALESYKISGEWESVGEIVSIMENVGLDSESIVRNFLLTDVS